MQIFFKSRKKTPDILVCQECKKAFFPHEISGWMDHRPVLIAANFSCSDCSRVAKITYCGKVEEVKKPRPASIPLPPWGWS